MNCHMNNWHFVQLNSIKDTCKVEGSIVLNVSAVVLSISTLVTPVVSLNSWAGTNCRVKKYHFFPLWGFPMGFSFVVVVFLFALLSIWVRSCRAFLQIFAFHQIQIPRLECSWCFASCSYLRINTNRGELFFANVLLNVKNRNTCTPGHANRPCWGASLWRPSKQHENGCKLFRLKLRLKFMTETREKEFTKKVLTGQYEGRG